MGNAPISCLQNIRNGCIIRELYNFYNQSKRNVRNIPDTTRWRCLGTTLIAGGGSRQRRGKGRFGTVFAPSHVRHTGMGQLHTESDADTPIQRSCLSGIFEVPITPFPIRSAPMFGDRPFDFTETVVVMLVKISGDAAKRKAQTVICPHAVMLMASDACLSPF